VVILCIPQFRISWYPFDIITIREVICSKSWAWVPTPYKFWIRKTKIMCSLLLSYMIGTIINVCTENLVTWSVYNNDHRDRYNYIIILWFSSPVILGNLMGLRYLDIWLANWPPRLNPITCIASSGTSTSDSSMILRTNKAVHFPTAGRLNTAAK